MYKIPDKTVFMGKRIISLPICESTNSLMISMAQTDLLNEGTIIITENQTGGRGQGGNRWLAEPGANLTFSFYLKPDFLPPSRQFLLNMAVGLAVCDCVLEILTLTSLPESKAPAEDLVVKLKWPNDILVNAKKICGILIENQIQGQQFSQSVVGIGLNINQKKFEFPSASSLSMLAGMDFNKSEIVERLLMKLEERYRQLRAKDFKKLTEDYYSVLYWKDEHHEFQSGEKLFKGTIVGVDEVGRLMVFVNGETTSFDFKAIKFIQ